MKEPKNLPQIIERNDLAVLEQYRRITSPQLFKVLEALDRAESSLQDNRYGLTVEIANDAIDKHHKAVA